MSIFDQYQAPVYAAQNATAVDRKPVSSGYVSARLQKDKPMFSRQKLQLRPPADITHLKVCCGHLVMVMTNGTLLRANLSNPDSPLDEMELQKQADLGKSADDRLHRLFMDPSGNHVVICMQSQDSFYLHRLSKKLRPLVKFKMSLWKGAKVEGMHIDSIAWNAEESTLYTTGAILFGTSKGQIWETKLDGAEEKFFQSVDQYTQKLFDLGAERPVSVSGIHVGRSTGKGNENRVYILVITPSCCSVGKLVFVSVEDIVRKLRLYEFGGIVRPAESPQFAGLFEAYKGVPEEYVDMPGESGYAELHVFRPSPKEPAVAFAWMASPGAYCGRIDPSMRFSSEGLNSVRLNPKLIQYQTDEDDKHESAAAPASAASVLSSAESSRRRQTCQPLAISVTEFHVALLFSDRLKVVCVLNEQVILEETVTETMGGQLRGIWRDEVNGIVWTFTDRAVFKYVVDNESRDVWKIYMGLSDFSNARTYCRDDPEKLDLVQTREAEQLFKQEKYEESAAAYSRTLASSFEEITLKFIEAKQDRALKMFLRKKLEQLDPKTEPLHVALLVMWLTEIWLTQLSRQKHIDWQSPAGPSSADTSAAGGGNMGRDQAEFQLFLRDPKLMACFQANRALVYSLIASHGDVEDMIYFAELMSDREKVISHKIQMDRFKEALDDLASLKPERAMELVYKFSPVLMQNVPKDTVKMWIKMDRLLDPKKLMPALVQYESSLPKSSITARLNDAIVYLDHCVVKLKNRDPTIHNYLLSLYAKYDPERLMHYLELQAKDEQGICYDVEYALRLCSDPRSNLRRACIHVYSTMQLYDEAVQLALQEDIELAKANACKPEEIEGRRKLWLQIAKHVISKQGDIGKAMEVLRESNQLESNLLRIEDILPFFPDFETIDHFKDAICTSLKEFNEHISGLKQDMEGATQSAEDIRQSIQKCRNKCVNVLTSERCEVCSFPLLTRGFYLFPCGHKFHSDCLMAEVIPNLLPAKRSKVDDLKRMLGDDAYSTSSATSGSLPADTAKAELDEIVAAECIYCGEVMIRSVDQPLVPFGSALATGWD